LDGPSVETVVTGAIKNGRDQLRWISNIYSVLGMLNNPDAHVRVFAATGVPSDGRKDAKTERVFLVEIRDSEGGEIVSDRVVRSNGRGYTTDAYYQVTGNAVFKD
jgi:hypothetical protein